MTAALLVTSVGSTASASSSPPLPAVSTVRPADTTGGCALPGTALSKPTLAPWKAQHVAAQAKAKAPTKTPVSKATQRDVRSASTSHVVPGHARNTPTTGYAARTVAPSVATGAAIKGTVTGPGATPVADARVQAYSQNNYFETGTAADGTYTLDVSADDYIVYVYDPSGALPAGYYSSTGFTANQSLSTTVTVVSSDVTGIDVQLPAPIWIKGKVTGPGPVNLDQISVGAYSEVYNNGGNAMTASDGTFQIPVAPGTYIIGFDDFAGTYASGYWSSAGFTPSRSAATPVVITASDVTGINVQMPVAKHISGVVTGPGGVPLENIWVWAEGQSYASGQRTAADGSYSITVGPDTYTVSFNDTAGIYAYGYYSSAGFTPDQSKATPVTVTTSNVGGISIRFPTPIFIKGTVTGPGGAPLENMQVGAWSAIYNVWTRTAADGTYSLSVVAGSYMLFAADPNGTYASGYRGTSGFVYDQSDAAAITITTATVSGINVQLPLAVHVRGTVTGAGSAPIAGIDVSVIGATFSNDAMTGADGTYSIVVNPGTYHVEFFDPSGTYVNGYYAAAGFTPDSNAATPVVVAAADVTGIDTQLPAPVFIRGTVTAPGGDPIAGIDVTATSALYWGFARTAADGTYAISVIASSYRVAFCDRNVVYGAGYYGTSGLTSDPNAALPVAVSTADVTGIDVELPLATHVSGTVTGTGGTPLANIQVWLYGNPVGTTTAADGTYSIPVGAAGSYLVGFSDPSHAYRDGFYSTSGFTTDEGAATPVQVAGADLTGISVQMTRTVPPTAGITALPAWAATNAIPVRWRATAGSNPVASYDVRVRRAAWSGAFGGYATWLSSTTATSATYTGVVGTTDCFSVRARDLYGITSAWTAETCTAVPLDDRSLTRSSGWVAGTGSAFYRSTYLRSSTYGAKLTRTGVVARRIAIVATSCYGCGTIRVYWGSTLVKTISLNATRTTNKRLFSVVGFSGVKSGTLKIVVVSSGKRVIIDGVAISRT